MGSYSNKTWACPFWGWASGRTNVIYGECGTHRFLDREEMDGHADRWCAGDWQACLEAQILMRIYDEAPED